MVQIDLRMVNSKRNESNDKNAKEWSAVSLRDKLFYDVTQAKKNGTSAKSERGWMKMTIVVLKRVFLLTSSVPSGTLEKGWVNSLTE